MARLTSLIGIVIGLAAMVAVRAADEPADGLRKPEAERGFLSEMIERVDGVHVRILNGSESKEAGRVQRPVFRYSDEEREIFDATLWLWTDEGRPVALQKDEAAASVGVPKWTVCFASFAAENIDVRWPRGDYGFATTAPGCEFQPIVDAPAPASSERLIRAQIKKLSQRFTAEHSYEGRGTTQARLLTRPIHEYASEKHGIAAGAVFGFASHGTNPDAYLLIELRKTPTGHEWVYGCVRMTIYAVQVSLDSKPVWSCQAEKPQPGYFKNWTFFFEPRPETSGN